MGSEPPPLQPAPSGGLTDCLIESSTHSASPFRSLAPPIMGRARRRATALMLLFSSAPWTAVVAAVVEGFVATGCLLLDGEQPSPLGSMSLPLFFFFCSKAGDCQAVLHHKLLFQLWKEGADPAAKAKRSNSPISLYLIGHRATSWQHNSCARGQVAQMRRKNKLKERRQGCVTAHKH